MLGLRVLTAVGMLAVLLPAVFFPAPLAFAVVAAVLVACATWEWFVLNGGGRRQALAAGVVSLVVCGLLWKFAPSAATHQSVWIASAVLWAAGVCALLYAGVPGWKALHPVMRQWVGFVMLCVAWLAVVLARMRGINFLFSVMALVWVADIAAYFVGRAFGGVLFTKKLAPTISPGKTREGALGGLTAIVLVGWVWVVADAAMAPDSVSIYTALAGRHWLWMVLGTLLLGVMSICGDLLESLVKRAAGAKDSSRLLPGHGGVLDRLDALLPVVPLAMFMLSL
ncbi:MAG: phosphatidate cytidylyltransferase [Rhodoferax sp.]|nr:phosphatidate cytidylyltransferase [Rhodoferax sp.]